MQLWAGDDNQLRIVYLAGSLIPVKAREKKRQMQFSKTAKLGVPLVVFVAGALLIRWEAHSAPPAGHAHRSADAETNPPPANPQPLVEVHAVPVTPAPAAAAPIAASHVDRDDSPRTEPPAPEDTIANMDVVYAAQPADRGWGAASARKLEDGLGRFTDSGSRIQSVDCRTSICKVVVSHPDVSRQQSFVSGAFGTTDYWTGPRAAIRKVDPNGDVSTLAFFGRDGTSLPVLD